MAADRESNFDVHVFACVACPLVSSAFASGWRAYRIDDPELGEPPQLGFYCPNCARREFGRSGGRPG